MTAKKKERGDKGPYQRSRPSRRNSQKKKTELTIGLTIRAGKEKKEKEEKKTFVLIADMDASLSCVINPAYAWKKRCGRANFEAYRGGG